MVSSPVTHTHMITPSPEGRQPPLAHLGSTSRSTYKDRANKIGLRLVS